MQLHYDETDTEMKGIFSLGNNTDETIYNTLKFSKKWTKKQKNAQPATVPTGCI